EMLAVDQGLALGAADGLHRRANRIEILVARNAERKLDMIIPGFRDEADRIGASLHDGLKARIVRCGASCAFRHAKGRELGLKPRRGLEKSGIDRIRAWIAALDIIEPKRIETSCDEELVMQREVDAKRLGSIAKRGVEKIETLFHGCSGVSTLS